MKEVVHRVCRKKKKETSRLRMVNEDVGCQFSSKSESDIKLCHCKASFSFLCMQRSSQDVKLAFALLCFSFELTTNE